MQVHAVERGEGAESIEVGEHVVEYHCALLPSTAIRGATRAYRVKEFSQLSGLMDSPMKSLANFEGSIAWLSMQTIGNT